MLKHLKEQSVAPTSNKATRRSRGVGKGKRMITAEVESAVHQLLHERGLKQSPDEKLGDFVARGLGISSKQANAFLAALNDGNSVEDAKLIAGIESSIAEMPLLAEIGRTIGATLGKIAARLKPVLQD